MASAYKCDRCGKLYESYDKNLNPIKDHTYDYILEIRKKWQYSCKRDECFDLCPNCYKKLANFIECYMTESEETE